MVGSPCSAAADRRGETMSSLLDRNRLASDLSRRRRLFHSIRFYYFAPGRGATVH